MIYIAGIVIAFFLSLLVLTKKKRNLADVIMGVWMIVIGFHLTFYYGFITKNILQYPFLLGLNIPIPFLHGVFLYLYAEALTEPHRFKSKLWLVHFILPVGVIGLYFPFYLLPTIEKLRVFETEGKGYEIYIVITTFLLSVSGIFYILITNRLLTRYEKKVLNYFSNQAKINLNWLRFLSYAMIGMWILIIFVKNDPIIFAAASIYVLLIGYFGIKQTGIFTNQATQVIENKIIEEKNAAIGVISNDKKKYAKSGLNESMAVDLHNRLKRLMENEKLFINPELSLADLAAKLETHPNYLSQVINEMEGKNFYDYINNLRVEEFKRMVAIPENLRNTLLALAFDCGFNSKSAFNRFFKKESGLSPSEYVNQISKNLKT